MKIPIFKLNFEDVFRKRFQEGCNQIFDSGILTNGINVKKFEERFKEVASTRYALTVNSGTAALEVVLRAIDVRDKKVIIPTNTFIATAVAVENGGGEMLPLDIEAETFALSPEELSRHLTSDIGAVIIVHIGGTISPHIFEIVKMCKKLGVPLIEDAAHAHGSQYKRKKAGSFGMAGCFSFYPTKVMTTGEGGIIVTNDKNLYEKIYSIRQFGMSPENKDLHIRSGSNFKMTEFQALLGLLDLERMPQRIKKRTELATVYQKELNNSSWKAIVPPPEGISSYYKQIVLSPVVNEEAHTFCKSYGIELTGEVYRFPLHKQPVYKGRFGSKKFPVTDKFCSKHICPPLYPELSKKEVLYVCSVLKKLKA